jgi:hypothetical protein
MPFALVTVAAVVDAWLASITAQAMDRAGLTQDYVSHVTGIPANKLSDQLAGKVPFTGFCRFGYQEIRRDTQFWPEFANVLADQVDRALVPRDLGTLLERVTELVSGQKRMLKADLPAADAQQEAM